MLSVGCWVADACGRHRRFGHCARASTSGRMLQNDTRLLFAPPKAHSTPCCLLVVRCHVAKFTPLVVAAAVAAAVAEACSEGAEVHSQCRHLPQPQRQPQPLLLGWVVQRWVMDRPRSRCPGSWEAPPAATRQSHAPATDGVVACLAEAWRRHHQLQLQAGPQVDLEERDGRRPCAGLRGGGGPAALW